MHGGRERPAEQREVISDEVCLGLQQAVSNQKEKGNTEPLMLKLSYPRNPEPVVGKVSEELLLVINLQYFDENEQVMEQTRCIRFNILAEGRFPSAEYSITVPETPLVGVEVAALDVSQ